LHSRFAGHVPQGEQGRAAEESEVQPLMPGCWLVAVSWISLALAFGSAAVILYDVYRRRYRQPMRIMEAVWPITALYFGPPAVYAYARWGRPASRRWLRQHGREEKPKKPSWVTYAVGVSHCGAGCTLGDIVAEFAVFGLAATIAGETLLAEYLGDYILAVALGLAFQYFAIAPMRGLGVWDGLVAAAKADILSLSAFEVGLFGWMALMAFVFFPAPQPASGQRRILVPHADRNDRGVLTSYPVNAWLIRRGIKEPM
jgi:Domain of unknown function (DUF4396)